MTLREKAAQLLVVAFHGTAADEALASNTALHGVATPAELVSTLGVGGVIYFNSPGGFNNVSSPAQLGRLSATLTSSGRPRPGADDADPRTSCHDAPLIAVDQEGGQVTRLTSSDGFVEFASAAVLGDIGDPDLAFRVAQARGEQAAAVGISLVLAPVADTDVASSSVLAPKGRSFSGSDPELVAEMVAATVGGHTAAGVASALKHFPNHGRVPGDTHLSAASLDVDRATWDEFDAVPFRAAIETADPLAMIMTGHLAAPGLHPDAETTPATLSPSLTTGLLRNELGHSGLVITDDLFGMLGLAGTPPGERLVRAIDAGADLLITTGGAQDAIEAITAAVEDGRLDEAADLDPSVRRILELKSTLGLHPAPSPRFDDATFSAAHEAATVIEAEVSGATQ